MTTACGHAQQAIWTVRGGRAVTPAPPHPFVVFGIVNVTPDSFHDGGRYVTHEAAVAHALRLVAEGAHVLDIGGESSRPYADAVPLEEELARVLPVVRGIRDGYAAHMADRAGNDTATRPAPDEADAADADRQAAPLRPGGAPLLSVDTYKAGTAAAVLDEGVDIINDISACAFDPGLLDVVAHYKPGYVLMHSLGRPETMQDAPAYANVMDALLAFFHEKMDMLVRAGLPESRILLDPGIGFGKLTEHNFEILRQMERFNALGRPVLMGLSNKSLFGGLLDLGHGQRAGATQVATALLAARGVLCHRVHDVAETVRTLRLTQAMAPAPRTEN
ncbi:dihydropteroate synthase [Nitratidesulfovibrio sp. SRB-5]|uniref:dihydropteroate synthase n=1 Tax=Nitratidesulfovibrio sp. SRB-5 TaxID=2872636 RepID=UPI00102508C8|nr:dihydropteroate synthase [Nitratidesulfovibrio sp. SRB-5]MBZ2171445.1 dihydropteroate synthase [Nitratidesulfovibrio sp. SRB-5]RXF78358.1 dihydropteroate synthase [Desulfovibrio sp. DS-1]